jgi:type IV secretory pathway VirB9-like protein
MLDILLSSVAAMAATAASAQPAQKAAPVVVKTAPVAESLSVKTPIVPVSVANAGPIIPPYAHRVVTRHHRPNPSTVRVDMANRAALMEPRASGYSNAVQIYPWSDGALYRLFAAPERVSDIALQAGEALVSVAAGDTVRWIVGDTTSGAGGDKRTHILIKPSAAGLKTNLVIATDRRAYHLQLESTAVTSMSAIS